MFDVAQAARAYALDEITQYGLPSQVNFDLAEKVALSLAQKLGGDEMIVRIGMSLMDIKLGQAFAEKRVAEHVHMSVQAASDFLNRYDIPTSQRDCIINCVAAHHGDTSFTCREAEICANADCYRFIHPTGFFGALVTMGRRTDNFSEVLTQVEQKLDEKYKILSLDICKNELESYYHAFKQYIADARDMLS